jgi:hypothetical protein
MKKFGGGLRGCDRKTTWGATWNFEQIGMVARLPALKEFPRI